jgi:hypothetical protein
MKHLVRVALVMISLTLIGINSSNAQQFYRIKADVSIKEKLANGSSRLSVGTVYFDKLYGKIVYKFTFPKVETIIVQDTTVFSLDAKNNLVEAQKALILPEFTIFHLALTNRLSDYGMKGENTYELYKIDKVEKKEGKVITTWTPNDPSLNKYLGSLVMSNNNKRLEAIAIYGPDKKLLSQQFFRKYVNVKGVEFPSQVTQLTYTVKESGGGDNIQQTTYANIQVDQASENDIYRHPVPLSQLPALLKKRAAAGPK